MTLKSSLHSHPYRAFKTFCIGLMFGCLGLHTGTFGPAMIDLKFQVNATVPQISRILPVRASGNMVGSILCGFLLEFFNSQVICLFSFLIICLSINLIPFCVTLYQLYACMAINGIFAGCLVNAGNVFTIHSWGKENGPFMQFSHFMFGFGAFFSPFIAEPFLKEIKDSDLDNLDNLMPNSNLINTTSDDGVMKISSIDSNDLKIKYAFYIIGPISLFIWFVYLITYIRQPTSKEHPSRQIKKANIIESKVNIIELKINGTDKTSIEKTISLDDSKKVVINAQREIKLYHKVILVLLAACFNHITYGLELSYGAMLPTYARISELRFSKSQASYITSLYWICYTCFRVACIALTTIFTPRTMLCLDLVLIFISNCFLAPLLFFETKSWLLWSSSATIGIGVSSVYATMWGFLEDIFPISGHVISVVNSCAVMGEFVVPTLIGAYIKQYPPIFIYVTLIYSLFGYISFAVLSFWSDVIRKYKNSYV